MTPFIDLIELNPNMYSLLWFGQGLFSETTKKTYFGKKSKMPLTGCLNELGHSFLKLLGRFIDKKVTVKINLKVIPLF